MFDNLPSRSGKNKIAREPRVLEKLLPNAVKLKELLSAGKVAMINILGIDNNQNLDGKLTREEFEAASTNELSRVYAPIEKVLASANMTLSDISWVEILGGSVRIPSVQSILKEKLGDKLGVHMNGDDSMAYGAAFIAANYSSNFKLAQKIQLYHGNAYELLIKLKHRENNTQSLCDDDFEDLAIDCVRKLNKSASLYRVRHPYETAKTVSMRHDGDFDVFVYERFPGEEARLLLKFEVSDVQESLSKIKEEGISDKPKVNLRFNLNRKGLISLAVCYYKYNIK